MNNVNVSRESCKETDMNKSDSEVDSSMYSLHTENRRRETVDLRNLLKDKISKNETFFSFEIVSKEMNNEPYQMFV